MSRARKTAHPELALAPKKPSKRELRSKLRKTLDKHGAHDLADILRRCEEPLQLRCINCGESKEVETGCRKRWCPVCANKIAAQKVAKFGLALKRMQWPLMVTLTVRSSQYAEQSVRDLVKAFFAFRRTKWWKACEIKGGIRGVEITWGVKGWHPHLHLLMDCEWLAVEAKPPHRGMSKKDVMIHCKEAQKELVREWSKACGQETAVVWVSRATPSSLREVIKYTIDPQDLVKMGPNAETAIRCMRHTRATQGWGNCHGLSKELEMMDAEQAPQCSCPGCKDPRWLPEICINTAGPTIPTGPWSIKEITERNAKLNELEKIKKRLAPMRQELRKLGGAWAGEAVYNIRHLKKERTSAQSANVSHSHGS